MRRPLPALRAPLAASSAGMPSWLNSIASVMTRKGERALWRVPAHFSHSRWAGAPNLAEANQLIHSRRYTERSSTADGAGKVAVRQY
jgi:hypothetical protein